MRNIEKYRPPVVGTNIALKCVSHGKTLGEYIGSYKEVPEQCKNHGNSNMITALMLVRRVERDRERDKESKEIGR